jgi:putative transposase
VVDAYKTGNKGQRIFRKHGSISYDSRILSYNSSHKMVSIWTIIGRQNIPYQASEKHLILLQYQIGESDLVYIKRIFISMLLAMWKLLSHLSFLT